MFDTTYNLISRDDPDMLDGQDNCCDCGRGFWTNIHSGVVFDCREGGNGSMPRDIYDDDPDYLKRSALHKEVIEPLRVLLRLHTADHKRLNSWLLAGGPVAPGELAHAYHERAQAIGALMDAHLLTDSPSTY
jgi:hypothetical protein